MNTNEAKVKMVYVCLLSRPPSAAELKLVKQELDRGALDISDVVWAVVNSHEFLFVM